MPAKRHNKRKVIFGGWYQRTTLHLSEIYDLFALGHSTLPLSTEKLRAFHGSLSFKSVTRQSGYLEFIQAETKTGIIIHYYEDGLYTLELESSDVFDAQKILEDYYENSLSPAISYIFSLGAPTPKVLANIKTKHPTVVTAQVTDFDDYEIDHSKFGEVYSKVVSGNFAVYKTPNFIFVLSNHESIEILSSLVDMQIFFREFKDQLEKYLNVHRIIWEEISDLKERKQIKGKEIREARTKLDHYQKTINLISSRINQMGTYIQTRQSIAKEIEIEGNLLKLYQYKFEVLSNTLIYIKELWKMTTDYLVSSIEVLEDLENTSLNNSVKSLQIITSIGVIAGVLGYITRDSLPKPTLYGLIFLGILIFFSVLSNIIISLIYNNIRYKMKLPERKEDI